MSDEPGSESPVAPATATSRRRGCFSQVFGSLLIIVVSAITGSLLTILFFWYGPAQVGLRMPDSTGRMADLERAAATAVIERTELRATLAGLSDLRESVNSLREELQSLQTEAASRNTNIDDVRAQVKASLDSLVVLQRRLDELESIPANASLANRLAEAELDLATLNAMIGRLRLALGAPPGPQELELPGAETEAETTATPGAGRATPTAQP